MHGATVRKKAYMIKFSVFYPYTDGSWFDSKYYVEKHIDPYRKDPLVKGIIVESGKCTRDFMGSPRYAAIAHFFYDSLEDLDKSRSEERVIAQKKDNPNFTNIKPVNLISQVRYCSIR